MCYSAQVVQVIRKLHRELGIRLDYTEALNLFLRRLDDPSVVISRGFEAHFDVPGAAGDSLGSNRARASACGLKGGMK